MRNPGSLPGPERFVLRPFDDIESPSALGPGQFLAVRLETRFMVQQCPMGEVDWCPDFGTQYNGNNPWVDQVISGFSDHYLYISYRTHDPDGLAKSGASLHVVKHRAGDWVGDLPPSSSAYHTPPLLPFSPRLTPNETTICPPHPCV